ncbi:MULTISPECIES: DUF4476 domain-containing protein [unclassified Corallococcus]|uniref:DUF4476 domain-containing protein n=1 Tax=unclassified Corallococcus TaxID=2685029 RepID=UPI001A8D5311|nr:MULTISPECIES: DUF4476 domain-containing protein [unclassified Corallococcus]MBN9687249.1 DUF4476 domain-containing protein [Corallococcus sp. NCSPR001]WAS88923.1 DUF4476 domain-containing protein [Corallococcus sp. NCRR]
MKALTLAVVLLSSAAALAQTAPTKAADSVNIAGGAEFRRPPPPGHSTPQPMPQPVPQRNQAVVDREQMARRIDRMEKALRDAMSRTRDAKGRDSIRNAMEELDKLSEYVDDAPPVVVSQPAPMPPPPPVVRPISDVQFRNITAAMVRESFPREKLRILSQVAPNENFLVTHILSVLGQFSFSNDKLEVVRLMRPTLLDPQNGYQLYQAFPFSNDKQQLQAILDSGGRY